MTLHESKPSAYPDPLGGAGRSSGTPPLGGVSGSLVGMPTGFISDRSAGIPQAPQPAAPRRPQRALYKHAEVGPLRVDGGDRSSADDLFDLLARLAEPENWAGPATARRDDTWVLREYVEQTFERLYEQRHILTAPDGAYSVFNTGLATPQQETIYGLFAPNRNPDGPPWQLQGWYPESDRELLDRFADLPGAATYTTDPADFVYDWRRELTVSAKHLLESKDNLAALPAPLSSNPYQAGLVLEGAVRRAEARVQRSYRAAVPCWDPVQERVLLLLPLSLTTPETVDVALALTREADAYRGHMLLGLDLAYARARQIARPEEWFLLICSAYEGGGR